MQIHLRTLAVSTAILSVAFLSPLPVVAESSVTITENGSASSNTTNVSQSSNTSVSSNNNAVISNSVETQASTGDNTASGNTGSGNTTVTSGDTSTSVEVENQANTSVVDTGTCCPQNTSVTQSGNGADSTNTTSVNTNNQTAISVTNNATITNTISIQTNTGNNKTDNNTNGDTKIKTGDIHIEGRIENKHINSNHVVASAATGGNTNIIIESNGSHSTNIVATDTTNIVVIDTENIADIDNDVVIEANTGGNTANKNTNGDVEIVTGDIDINFSVINKDINSNVAIVDCCEKAGPSPSPSPMPTEKPAPSMPPSHGGGGGGIGISSGGISGGGVGGVSVGGPTSAAPSPAILGQAILPVTGFSMPFRLVLSVGFALGFLGIFLRLLAKRYAAQWQVDQRQVIRLVQRNHFDP